MAILAKLETDYGETRKLYVRLNNFDQLTNHEAPAIARFRGFISRAAFIARRRFVYERVVEFRPDHADGAPTIWRQGYYALTHEIHHPPRALPAPVERPTDEPDPAPVFAVNPQTGEYLLEPKQRTFLIVDHRRRVEAWDELRRDYGMYELAVAEHARELADYERLVAATEALAAGEEV